mmetsp:Transcript_63816/g.74743  ORF Transcript_63816/g.74743 Transcript_63816/m.74743 type:complete len:300 (+) Transcript_63816:176-1075(+)
MCRAAAALAKSPSYWTVSFSGAGHLLPYHLGAARSLLASQVGLHNEPERVFATAPLGLPVRAVAGSSSGAIAAAVMALLPHRLEEYADRFLQDRGHALRNLTCMLQEETSVASEETRRSSLPLTICTTKCSDGSMQLFDFPDEKRDLPYLLHTIQASCTIPPTFHPYDIISSRPLSYPEEGAIKIDGFHYVDGGIAAPAPPTPFDMDVNSHRIVISPLSGGHSASECSIRPRDTSWSLPWDITASRDRSFRIRPSVQNLQALLGSIGAASPAVLKKWYDRGTQDAEWFLNDWNQRFLKS